MKRFLLFLIVLFVSICGYAQLHVDEKSFMEIDGFQNSNPDKQTDDNYQPYAVIIMKLSNITEAQSKELIFEGDARTYIEVEYKKNELWLYVSYYATFLKISHPDFSSTEFTFPYDLGKGKGYMMKLVNSASTIVDGWGSITIVTLPEDGATVTINGMQMKNLTPYKNSRIRSGVYTITVEREYYKPVTQTVELQANEDKTVRINMPLNYATITLSTEKDIDIILDGENVAKGQWTGRLTAGSHEVKCNKMYHKPYSQKFNVKPGENMQYSLDLQPIVTKANINSMPAGATVFIDGNKKGSTPVRLDSIIIGPHNLKFIKSRYYDVNMDIVLEEGKPFTINKQLVRNKRTKRFFNRVFGSIGDYFTEDVNSFGFFSYDVEVNNNGRPKFGMSLSINAFKVVGVYGSINVGGFGWLLSDTIVKCDKDYLVDGGYPQYNGNYKNPRYSLKLGLVLFSNRNVSLRAGVGYSSSKIYYRTDDVIISGYTSKGVSVLDKERSWKGWEYSVGIQFTFDMLLISADYIAPISNAGLADFQAIKVGLGFNMIKK